MFVLCLDAGLFWKQFIVVATSESKEELAHYMQEEDEKLSACVKKWQELHGNVTGAWESIMDASSFEYVKQLKMSDAQNQHRYHIEDAIHILVRNDKNNPKPVSQEEVLKELGDPSTWDQEEAKLMEKFHQIQITTKEILEHE